jgi:hypothetical protein
MNKEELKRIQFAERIALSYENTNAKYLTRTCRFSSTPTKIVSLLFDNYEFVQLDAFHYAIASTKTLKICKLADNVCLHQISFNNSFTSSAPVLKIIPNHLVVRYNTSIIKYNWQTGHRETIPTNSEELHLETIGPYIIYTIKNNSQWHYYSIDTKHVTVDGEERSNQFSQFLPLPHGQFILNRNRRLSLYDLRTNVSVTILPNHLSIIESVQVLDDQHIVVTSKKSVYNFVTDKTVKSIKDNNLASVVVVPNRGLLWWKKTESKSNSFTVQDMPEFGGYEIVFSGREVPNKMEYDGKHGTLQMFYRDRVEIYAVNARPSIQALLHDARLNSSFVDIAIR